jgi:hypothetical protein
MKKVRTTPGYENELLPTVPMARCRWDSVGHFGGDLELDVLHSQYE